MADTILSLLKEARRDWITDERWEGDQYGGCMVPTGEALRAFGARIDAAVKTAEQQRPETLETARCAAGELA